MTRPDTLTRERAWSFLPKLIEDPEWRRRRDAGELPDGIAGLRGSVMVDWSGATAPTRAEAEYILHLRENRSWRALGCALTGDDSQFVGMSLEQAAYRALASEGAA